jgi:hypothetical protein
MSRIYVAKDRETGRIWLVHGSDEQDARRWLSVGKQSGDGSEFSLVDTHMPSYGVIEITDYLSLPPR